MKLIGWIVPFIASALLLLFLVSGCQNRYSGNGKTEESEAPSTPGTKSVSVAVSVKIDSKSGSTSSVNTLKTLFPERKSSITSMDEIVKITIEVSQSGKAVKPSTNLVKTGGKWGLTLSGLPADSPLLFSAKGYDKTGKLALSGSQINTFSKDASIEIPLSIEFEPEVFSIKSFKYFDSPGADGTSRFTMEIMGTAGQSLVYQFESAAAGSFSPKQGSVVLDSAGAAEIISEFTTPPTAGTYPLGFSLTDGSLKIEIPFSIHVLSVGAGTEKAHLFPQIVDFIVGPRVGSNLQFEVGATGDQSACPVTYQWSFHSDVRFPDVTFVNRNTAKPTLLNYHESVTGTVSVQLSDSGSNSSTLHYELVDGLFPDCLINCGVPTARAGSDFSIEINQPFALDGTSSSDPDDLALSYSWAIVSKPPASSAYLIDDVTEEPVLTPDRVGTYSIQLTVNNGAATDADTITVEAVTSQSSVSRPTFKLSVSGDSRYKIQLLSPIQYQARMLTGMGGVSLSCPGLNSINGDNQYTIQHLSIGDIAVFSFQDMDNNLSIAGAELDILSFSCNAPPYFSLTDSVSINYKGAETVSGLADIDTIDL